MLLCYSSSAEKAERECLGMQRLPFHSYPDVITQKRENAGYEIRRDLGPDFKVNKNTKVCSLHFTADNYIGGNAMNSARCVLKDEAIPSVFFKQKKAFTEPPKLHGQQFLHIRD